MTTIYLVRHGHTVVADDNIVAGFTDVALSDKGVASLNELKKTMGTRQFDTCHTSDLIRTQQSMHSLTDQNYLVDARIKELDFGDWEGMSWTDVHQQHPEALNTWSNNWVNNSPPNGETFKALSERCQHWLDEQVANEQQTILVTAHGGSIRALLCVALALPLKHAMQFDINHASVTKLVLDNKGNRCAFANQHSFDNK